MMSHDGGGTVLNQGGIDIEQYHSRGAYSGA